jgi:hypothetical protein
MSPSTLSEVTPWSVNEPPTTTFIAGLPINVITGATTSGGAIILLLSYPHKYLKLLQNSYF